MAQGIRTHNFLFDALVIGKWSTSFAIHPVNFGFVRLEVLAATAIAMSGDGHDAATIEDPRRCQVFDRSKVDHQCVQHLCCTEGSNYE
jgi:hypothetical protein